MRRTAKAREEAGQLRLLPTVAEIRRRKQAEQSGEQLQCWSCRSYKPIARVKTHPDTRMDCCDTCWDDHPKRYDAWLTRKIKAEEAEF